MIRNGQTPVLSRKWSVQCWFQIQRRSRLYARFEFVTCNIKLAFSFKSSLFLRKKSLPSVISRDLLTFHITSLRNRSNTIVETTISFFSCKASLAWTQPMSENRNFNQKFMTLSRNLLYCSSGFLERRAEILLVKSSKTSNFYRKILESFYENAFTWTCRFPSSVDRLPQEKPE